MPKKNRFPIVKHFKRIEFDSPDIINSGNSMDIDFVLQLNEARKVAGIPFIINSGFRSRSHNIKVGGTIDSSHLLGLAVDIKCTNSKDRFTIIQALLSVGFNRIGIRGDFIHVDADLDKTINVIWIY